MNHVETRPAANKKTPPSGQSALVSLGQLLLQDNSYLVAGFPDHFLGEPIDWFANPFDNRTWQWHLHQLGMLPALLAVAATSDGSNGLERALHIIFSWRNACLDNTTYEPAWHDHGSAIRARNILATYQCWLSGHHKLQGIWRDPDINHQLVDLLAAHAKRLAEDSFYSQGTNHGFDQSMVLLTLSCELAHLDAASSWKHLATQRINSEITQAFRADGGHVENSPAYLNYGLKQAIEAVQLGRQYLGSTSSISFNQDLLNKAAQALVHITRPDGLLPYIGDTSEFKVRDFFDQIRPSSAIHQQLQYVISAGKRGMPPQQTDLVLLETGYAIFREHWPTSGSFLDPLHLVFKAGFLSTYHRHDDDLHFVLYARGEDWLIDGGLYKHAPKDPYRVYMRSPSAHNLSVPYAVRASRDLNLCRSSITRHGSSVDHAWLAAESTMFSGYLNQRELSYQRSTATISLQDRCSPVEAASQQRQQDRVASQTLTYQTRFLVPNDKTVTPIPRGVLITGRTHQLKIIVTGPEIPQVAIRGARQEPPVIGWYSRKPNLLERATLVEFNYRGYELTAQYILSLTAIC